jgi:hypothetical protein
MSIISSSSTEAQVVLGLYCHPPRKMSAFSIYQVDNTPEITMNGLI